VELLIEQDHAEPRDPVLRKATTQREKRLGIASSRGTTS